MPLGHIGINVTDIPRAREYYDAVMPLLDYEPFLVRDEEFSYRPAGGKPGTYVFFYRALEPGTDTRHRPGLQHLAFMLRTRAAVHAAHAWALGRRCEIVYEPQEFPEYHSGYFAAFWLDPEGIMLEAVCHRDEGSPPENPAPR
jgi:catechol 2,3-dioxygenase-like lactoylglutathione lyase family enzyme